MPEGGCPDAWLAQGPQAKAVLRHGRAAAWMLWQQRSPAAATLVIPPPPTRAVAAALLVSPYFQSRQKRLYISCVVTHTLHAGPARSSPVQDKMQDRKQREVSRHRLLAGVHKPALSRTTSQTEARATA